MLETVTPSISRGKHYFLINHLHYFTLHYFTLLQSYLSLLLGRAEALGGAPGRHAKFNGYPLFEQEPGVPLGGRVGFFFFFFFFVLASICFQGAMYFPPYGDRGLFAAGH